MVPVDSIQIEQIKADDKTEMEAIVLRQVAPVYYFKAKT